MPNVAAVARLTVPTAATAKAALCRGDHGSSAVAEGAGSAGGGRVTTNKAFLRPCTAKSWVRKESPGVVTRTLCSPGSKAMARPLPASGVTWPSMEISGALTGAPSWVRTSMTTVGTAASKSCNQRTQSLRSTVGQAACAQLTALSRAFSNLPSRSSLCVSSYADAHASFVGDAAAHDGPAQIARAMQTAAAITNLQALWLWNAHALGIDREGRSAFSGRRSFVLAPRWSGDTSGGGGR